MNIEHRAEYTVGIWQKARVSEIILSNMALDILHPIV